MSQTNPNWNIWAIDEQGLRSPFAGTGLRATLSEDTWGQIDFDRPQNRGAAIMVGGCAVDGRSGAVPFVTVHPRCGNFVTATIGIGQGPPSRQIELFSVDNTEIRKEIMDWLKRTTSGDPVGEIARNDPARTIFTARKMELEYGDIATVELTFPPPDDFWCRSCNALFSLDILVKNSAKMERGVPFDSLDLSVHICAANAVDFVFTGSRRMVR